MIDYAKWPFVNCISTLQMTSRDTDADVVMTSSTLTAVNFDRVKKAYVRRNRLANAPRSCDALMNCDQNTVYLIEFKNGEINEKVIVEIHEKVRDSVIILLDLVGENLAYSKNNIELILVYNDSKNAIKGHIAAKSGSPMVLYGLNKFKKYLFKDVHTIPQTDFEMFLNLHFTQPNSDTTPEHQAQSMT